MNRKVHIFSQFKTNPNLYFVFIKSQIYNYVTFVIVMTRNYNLGREAFFPFPFAPVLVIQDMESRGLIIVSSCIFIFCFLD